MKPRPPGFGHAGGRHGTAWWLGTDGAPGSVLRDCLTAATAAPSIHNTQPWLFHPRQQGVDIYADRSRQVPVIDPTGRELLISVGAAVFNLRVAVRAHGRIPVQVIQPASRRPDLMARVSPGAPAVVPYTARTLAQAIPLRRSNRWPFNDVALPPGMLLDLITAATAEGATMRVLGRDARRTVFALLRSAEEQWRDDPAYRWELARWTHDRPDRRDGIPAAAFGPACESGHLPLRDLGPLRRLGQAETRFEHTPTVAIIYGVDTPPGWLRVGQALARVLLTATVHGVAATLLTHALEIPHLREPLRDPLTKQPAQLVLRLGFARRPAAPAPRRPLNDLLLPTEAVVRSAST